MDFTAIHDPALLAFSPGFTGYALPATPHSLILVFGELQELREPWPASRQALFEPPVLHDPHGPDDPEFREGLAAGDAGALLGWWVGRLNVLYSHGLDPTRWRDGTTGEHEPAVQTAWLVTLERLLADALLLLGQPSAPDISRLESAFDLLDKAEALLGYGRRDSRGRHRDSGKGFKALLRRSRAQPRLETAFAGLPAGLRERFQARPARLYDALYHAVLAETMVSRRTNGGVKVAQDTAANLVSVPNEKYVARLCRAVRNSAHGVLDTLTDGPDRFVLATHSCDVPTAFPWLAATVMFALVADAEALCGGTWARDLTP